MDDTTYPADEHRRWLERLPKRISSAALMLESPDGRLLIVKANYKKYWSLPGGIIDPEETPKQAAVREAQEEVGLSIDSSQPSFVAVVNRDSDVTQTYQFLFKAKLSQDQVDSVVLQADEIDAYLFVSKEEIKKAERNYAMAIRHWADGTTGYIEQDFGKDSVY